MSDDPISPGTFFVDLKGLVTEHGGLRQVLETILGVEAGDESDAMAHVDDFITNLGRYFRCEERMMEMVSYPLRAVHAAEHHKILELSSHALIGGVGHRVSLDAIARNLREVFRAHEERFDLVVADYLRKKYSL